MNTRAWWGIIIILFVIIVVLTWVLFGIPAPVEAPTVSTNPPQATSTEPLSKRVITTSPKANAVVGKKFIVAGSAPGNWYFEAVFPIQVRDKDNNKIAQAIATAQGEWMTTDQVTFTATITISGNYTGPATVVLLRDNPSGLPENDDSVSIPIVIQ